MFCQKHLEIPSLGQFILIQNGNTKYYLIQLLLLLILGRIILKADRLWQCMFESKYSYGNIHLEIIFAVRYKFYNFFSETFPHNFELKYFHTHLVSFCFKPSVSLIEE